MRIRKRQVPLPLSSLLPVPLSDLYSNRSPRATARFFSGGYRDGNVGGFPSLHQLPPPSPISDRLIQRDFMKTKKDEDKALDDDNGDGDVDVKSRGVASGSKNGNPPGEVVEKNKKVVSLRKRSGFIRFDDYEYDEEEASDGGCGNKGKKKAKKSSTGAVEEGSRCSRVNGRGWRCCQKTLVGYSLCEHHLGKGRVRSMINKSTGGGHGGEKKAVAAEVKKKRVKLGMVKARSISSLLGQTSTSGGNGGDVESEIISAPADQFASYVK